MDLDKDRESGMAKDTLPETSLGIAKGKRLWLGRFQDKGKEGFLTSELTRRGFE